MFDKMNKIPENNLLSPSFPDLPLIVPEPGTIINLLLKIWLII